MDLGEATRIAKAFNKTGKFYRQAQADLLRPLGLHPGQDVVLWYLAKSDSGVGIAELAKSLGIEPPTLTRTLARMDAGGWFVREKVAGDRRAVRIRLTAAGRSAVPRIEAIWIELGDRATRGLPDDHRSRLLDDLDAVRDNLA